MTASSFKITDLGTLGGQTSEAAGLNNEGTVVGSSVISPSEEIRAFAWLTETMVALNAPKGGVSRAYAVNGGGVAAGDVISGDGEAATVLPALWQSAAYMPLPTPAGLQGSARDINDAGTAAGHTLGESSNQILLWDEGVLTQTIEVALGLAQVNALNEQSQIVGSIHDGAANSAFLWNEGAFVELGTLGGQNSIAYDINDAAQIVGAAATDGDLATHAFLWQDGQMVDLGTHGDVFGAASRALGINAAGTIVGEAQVGDEMHAVVWEDGVLIDLNSLLPAGSEWDLLRTAVSINDKGWIAGTGLINGFDHAFLMQPPSTSDFLSYLPFVTSLQGGPTPTNTPGPSPTPTVTPSPTTTSTPGPTSTPTSTPTPSPTPSTTGYDMTKYMIGDSRIYMVRFSDGSQARHQTQTEGVRFWHTKGNEILAEWEELWSDAYYIYRGTDTSPGNREYYTLFENGTKGSKWSPRYWKIGDVFERNPYVVFSKKSDCQTVRSGSARTWLKFEAYYKSYTFPTGRTLPDVVQLAWLLTPNSEPEERYYYAKDYGLVGWSSQSRGFSSITPEILGPEIPDNRREVIGCLNGALNQPLVFTPELDSGPLPEEYVRLVK